MDFYIRRITRALSRESIPENFGSMTPAERDAADAAADTRLEHRAADAPTVSFNQPRPRRMNRDRYHPEDAAGGGGCRLAVDQVSAQNNRAIKRPGIRGIRTISAVTIRGPERRRGRRVPPRAFMATLVTRREFEGRGGRVGNDDGRRESRGATITPNITSACGRQSRRSACRAYYRLYHTGAAARSENRRRVPRFTRR